MSFGGCGFGAGNGIGNGNGRAYGNGNGIIGSNGCNAGCPGQGAGQVGRCGPQGQGQGQGCPPCCPPIVIKTPANCAGGQCVVFQLPPVNVVCEIPPVQTTRPPRMCCVPIIVCEEECPDHTQGAPSCHQVPIDYCCNNNGNGNGLKGGNGNGNYGARCGPRPY